MATSFRTTLYPSDPADIESLVRDTGFFSSEEIAIARELADDGLAQGSSSHYHFILADREKTLAGYACFGPVPCTRAAWDLYWIAVAPSAQGDAIGSELLQRVELAVVRAEGTHIYVDTSSREQYVPTRAFYLRRGFEVAASFPDFYAPGDGKLVFSKVLSLTTAY
jgi:ribosomal protein S18 acetylase RimI-like enzyme